MVNHTLRYTPPAPWKGMSCTADASADLTLDQHRFIICNPFKMAYYTTVAPLTKHLQNAIKPCRVRSIIPTLEDEDPEVQED